MRRSARLAVLTSSLVVAFGAGPAFSASPVMAVSGAKSWLIILAAIAAGLGAFLLLIVLFGGGQSKRDSAIAGRLTTYGSRQKGKTGIFGRFGFLRRAAASADRAAESRGDSRMIESALEQANIPLTPGEAIIGVIGLGFIAGLVIGLVTQSFIWATVAGAAVLIISFLYVSSIASKQKKKFDNQLPDTLNLLATSLRAGYSIMQAIEAVAKESPEPSRREFGRAMAEIRLGRPMIDSLDDIAERMESQDFEWTVLAISIQREVGGNLAEVLQTTAEMMVQRNRLRREMKALTAEGRISAVVMSLLPFVIFGGIYLINKGYLEPLVTTVLGWGMIAGSLVLMVAGIVWMQKIVRVEV